MVNSKGSISSKQLMFMAMGSALGFPYTIMPILYTMPKNRDVWIVLLLSFVYVIILNLPLLIIINKFRGLDINQATEMIAGKVLGKISHFLLFLFFMFCFTACMLMTYIFIDIYLLPETPEWAFLLYMLVPITYAAYKGAGTIARVATFIVPAIILSVLFFFLLGIQKMDLDLIKPILAESSLWDINLGAFLSAARYSEIFIFVVFSFYLKKKASINKTYFGSVMVFSIIFFLMVMSTLLVLGYDVAQNEFNPYFVFSRQLEITDFVKRVQALNILVWFPDAMLKLCLYNFMASYILSGGLFKTKSYKTFVIPLSILAFFICLLPILNNSNTVILLRSGDIFPYLALSVTFIIPLIFLIVYFIRKKKLDLQIKERIEKNTAEEDG